MYKKYDCLICSYMEEAVHEIMPAYQDYLEYKRVDIADSAGTLCNAAEALRNAGASEVCAYIIRHVAQPNGAEQIP